VDERPDRLRTLRTDELRPAELEAIRRLMDRAFGDDPEEAFADEDWEHALGGDHVLLERDGTILAHGAVVERELHVAGRPLRTGYVEAVATAPEHQGQGHGTRVMRAIGDLIHDRFELGALGTGSHGFYERLGWRTWRGPSSVRAPGGDRPTPDEDGYLMVLRTPRTPLLALDAPISCDWRSGDVW
jgi:aminoglycoside 2'-N-acetyltransferase I